MEFIPITAVIALMIFILKEIIEARRRWQADKRKRKASCTLLAEEIERNTWTLKLIKRLIEDCVTAHNEKTLNAVKLIKEEVTGDIRFQLEWKNGKYESNKLFHVHVDRLERLIHGIAELDEVLFEKAQAYGISAMRLRYIRSKMMEFGSLGYNAEDIFVKHFLTEIE